MHDIITVGSATVDVFVKTEHPKIVHLHGEHDVVYPIGAKLLISDLHMDTGGGGTNTAVAFSRLGFKTGYSGVVGDDEHGEIILKMLKKEDVSYSIQKEKGMSGYSVILIGIEKDRTIFAYKGVNDKYDYSNDVFDTKWIYMSAMIGHAFKASERIALEAKKKGIPYAFNPSSYLAKKGLNYLKKIIDGCSVLILNKEEAGYLVGGDNVDNRLKKLQQYAKIVVITDGKNGAYAYNGITKYFIKPHKVKIADTTGAGDSFAAGFVAGIMMKKDIEYALRLGLEESESVIRYIGAKNKLLTRREAEQAINKSNSKVSKEEI